MDQECREIIAQARKMYREARERLEVKVEVFSLGDRGILKYGDLLMTYAECGFSREDLEGSSSEDLEYVVNEVQAEFRKRLDGANDLVSLGNLLASFG